MSLGLKSTLFAGVITLSAFAPAYAAAPLISNLPDITVGDLEDSTEATDNNLFVFSDAFAFNDFVVDADTTVSTLMWSFGEFSADENGGLADSQYTINGKPAVNIGDAAIAADEAANHPNTKAPGSDVWINQEADTASFRDIVLSPPADSAPYPEPSADEKTSASAGKVVRYYVSDGTSVDWSDAIVRTVDDANDTSTPAGAGWEEQIRDADLSGSDWVDSGLAWSAVTNNKANGELTITVQPTQGRSRIFGWANPNLFDYDSVGAGKFVRGKFYIYTNVSVLEPINKVPNFRLRLTHESAVNAAVHYELAQTGTTDPGYEPFYNAGPGAADAELKAGYWLRPADNALSPTPSLYRVDFDPVDVPAAAGSAIGALMESYAVSDAANGTLYLTEVVLGTYNALSGGALVWEYNRNDGLAEASNAGGPKVQSGGGFNHEANLTPGYLQDLYFPNVDQGGYFAIDNQGAAGVLASTAAVNNDVFGIGLLNFASASNTDKLRIEENKLYHTRFYATASVPTDSDDANVESQGALRFRFQTAANTVSYLLDMTTLAAGSLNSAATPNADGIASQALPGIGSQNPDTDVSLDTAGEDGGWYSVVAASPMDWDGIRNDVETVFDTNNDVFFFLNAEPGPGEADDSARDVTLGVDLIQAPANLTVSGVTVPFGRPNRAEVRISAIEVYAYPSIDDDGFDASSTSVHPVN